MTCRNPSYDSVNFACLDRNNVDGHVDPLQPPVVEIYGGGTVVVGRSTGVQSRLQAQQSTLVQDTPFATLCGRLLDLKNSFILTSKRYLRFVVPRSFLSAAPTTVLVRTG